MNCDEMYLLGRRLMRLAEGSFPHGEGAIPPSVRLVLLDIAAHSGSSIGEIRERTGFPQSHVSNSVARLRSLSVVETLSDAGDGRRTLVRLRPGFRERFAPLVAVQIDRQLASALSEDSGALARTIDALETLSAELTPRTGHGPRDRSPAPAVADANSPSGISAHDRLQVFIPPTE